MKLLVFSPYYPPHIGGLESHADEFNKYLSLKGIDITVFTPQLPKDAPENEMKYNDVKIIRFPAFEIIPNYPLPKFWEPKFWKLFFDLFGKKFDIVISRTRFFNTSLLALIYAKIKKVRWIHIEHGSDFVKSGGKLSTLIAKIYDHTFGKLVIKKADDVIANSEASADFCKKLAKNIHCEVIYRGVEIEKIESVNSASEIKNKYPNDFIITFIGRLIDGKGVSDLLNAVRDMDINFKLFIIGDGPQKENLIKLAKELRIKNKVIFWGNKKWEDAIALLKISDIFVNPSYTEGLPSSVVEAALCGIPIIATDAGGTNEIIIDDKNGILIRPRDIASLRQKINLLLSDSAIGKKLSDNAFEKATDIFDWQKNIEEYIKILEK